MKVLAISASPRKCGNAEVLCDEFLKGAAESGHDVQKIRLAEKKIAPCLACYACAGSHVCVRRDDMAEVLEALKAAGSKDPKAVNAALWDVKYDGVTGAIAFDETGDAIRDVAFIKHLDTANSAWELAAVQGKD